MFQLLREVILAFGVVLFAARALLVEDAATATTDHFNQAVARPQPPTSGDAPAAAGAPAAQYASQLDLDDAEVAPGRAARGRAKPIILLPKSERSKKRKPKLPASLPPEKDSLAPKFPASTPAVWYSITPKFPASLPPERESLKHKFPASLPPERDSLTPMFPASLPAEMDSLTPKFLTSQPPEKDSLFAGAPPRLKQSWRRHWDEDCNEASCARPHCACASDEPPAGLRPDQTPQFVMLTFDDAVTETNMIFYRELLEGSRRKNKKNGCGIAATFFVSHEYTDYTAVNELHSWGNEIALHSISHRTNSTYWQTINSTQWEREVLDQKLMMEAFAKVPAVDVTGVRGPFLYTGGDRGFRMLQQHFRYDCTLVHPRRRRSSGNPYYPYTMDYGFRHQCNIFPCPNDTHRGLWIIPLNVLFRELSGEEVPCATADACTPQPTTANDTFEYFRSNFEDFYGANRAPFPLFLHEAYLRNPARRQGYLQFIDWLLRKDDVYLVTISEVLRFMQDPKPLGTYAQHVCPGRNPVKHNSCLKKRKCRYTITPPGSERYMRTCSRCPKNYPWVGNPLGH